MVVTVGISDVGFWRLLEATANALPSGVDVLWQVGNNVAAGLRGDVRSFLAHDELGHAMEKADLVICHAGVGSVLTAFGAGHCPIVVPRRLARGEHVDDHQEELARSLAARGLAIAVEADELDQGVLSAAATRRVVRVSEPPAYVLGTPAGRRRGVDKVEPPPVTRRLDGTPGPTPERGGLLFVAWGAVGGRSTEIAASLGGRAACLYPPGSARRPSVLPRYGRSTLETVRLLVSHRPEAIIVTNPPVIPGLIGLAWSRLTGIRIGLDSHPGAFGAMDDRSSARMIPVHRWLARRVDVSLVAAPVWRAAVESWGGRAMVLHEAPSWTAGRATEPDDRFRVLYVGTFSGDEPVETVCAAAALLQGCDVLITGDPAEAPTGLVESAPGNVRFVGFLDTADYRREIERPISSSP